MADATALFYFVTFTSHAGQYCSFTWELSPDGFKLASGRFAFHLCFVFLSFEHLNATQLLLKEVMGKAAGFMEFVIEIDGCRVTE